MTLYVRQAAAEDPVLLAPYLRQADRNEIAAASGQSPLEALTAGYQLSSDPRTVTENGTPIAMFGVVPVGPYKGVPWMLGSGQVEANWFSFIRRSRQEFDTLRRGWFCLENMIDERNTLHIRWIEWLGFELLERVDSYGVGRLPFWRFALEAPLENIVSV